METINVKFEIGNDKVVSVDTIKGRKYYLLPWYAANEATKKQSLDAAFERYPIIGSKKELRLSDAVYSLLARSRKDGYIK